LAIVMTFSIIFTFTDFQLVYAITRGGPVNSTHLLATLAFQRGIAGGELGEGAAIAVSMVPFTIAILRYAVDVDGGLAGEPEDIALRDRVLQVLFLALIGTVGAAVILG